MYLVSAEAYPNMSVNNFAFEKRADAVKFAKDLTRSSFKAWEKSHGRSGGYSGCEGLVLYVFKSTDADHTAFESVGSYQQGEAC